MRYKCIISYDGKNYYGFQVQEDLPTIELELEKAIKTAFNVDVDVYASGRTDRYVHAVGQVIHFDLPFNVNENGVKSAMNSFLPPDIYVRSVEIVDESFHSRFSAISKEYRYYINFGEYNPLKNDYSMNITYLNKELLEKGLEKLKGKHDFKGFASASIDPRKDTIKEIYEAKLNIVDNNYYEIIFIGNGFLKYQIRRMVGLLIDIARGKEDLSMIDRVFTECDPKISHRVADGKGLVLYKVNY